MFCINIDKWYINGSTFQGWSIYVLTLFTWKKSFSLEEDALKYKLIYIPIKILNYGCGCDRVAFFVIADNFTKIQLMRLQLRSWCDFRDYQNYNVAASVTVANPDLKHWFLCLKPTDERGFLCWEKKDKKKLTY